MMDLESATDEQLLAMRAPGAAGLAFACFYRRHERVVLAFHVRRTRQAETAADLTAETFLQALSSRSRFRGDADGAAVRWLFGIAAHVYARHVRKDVAETRRHALVAATGAGMSAEQGIEIEALGGPGPLEEALAALPEHQRSAVQAYVLDERSYDDIARTAGLTQATVRKRVSRGIAALRASTKEAR